MAELIAVALAAAAVCLSYGADGPRDVPRWAVLRPSGRARAARLFALGLLALGLWLWNRAEPGPAAFLALPLALLAAGTLLTLGAPLVLGRARDASGSRRAITGSSASRRALAAEPPLEGELPAAPQHDAERSPAARARLGRGLLVIGVTLGTLPVALLASAAIARFLPVSADARFAAGFALAIPLWQLGMCSALLARRAHAVLAVCATLSLALAALVFGIQP